MKNNSGEEIMENTIEIWLATHNGRKYIRELLDSLLTQSYENILLTIYDDYSQDDTA